GINALVRAPGPQSCRFVPTVGKIPLDLRGTAEKQRLFAGIYSSGRLPAFRRGLAWRDPADYSSSPSGTGASYRPSRWSITTTPALGATLTPSHEPVTNAHNANMTPRWLTRTTSRPASARAMRSSTGTTRAETSTSDSPPAGRHFQRGPS